MALIALDEWCQFTASAAATAAIGHLSGGRIGTTEQDASHNLGVGGQDSIVWGMITPQASLETIYKGDDLLLNAARTLFNQLPGTVGLWGGINDSSSTLSWRLSNGYINRCVVACGGVGEPVAVNYDVVALSATLVPAPATPVTQATATAPFVWSESAVTINSAAYDCTSFSAELANNIRLESDLDIKTSGSKRFPVEAIPGNEIVTVSLTLKAPVQGISLLEDDPEATFPMDASFAFSNGYTTKTLTLRTLRFTNQDIPFEQGDATVGFDVSMESRHNARASASTAPWAVA